MLNHMHGLKSELQLVLGENGAAQNNLFGWFNTIVAGVLLTKQNAISDHSAQRLLASSCCS